MESQPPPPPPPPPRRYDAAQSSPFSSVIDFWPQLLYDFEGSILRVDDCQSVSPSVVSQSAILIIFSSVGAKLQNVIEASSLSASLRSVGSEARLRDPSRDDEAARRAVSPSSKKTNAVYDVQFSPARNRYFSRVRRGAALPLPLFRVFRVFRLVPLFRFPDQISRDLFCPTAPPAGRTRDRHIPVDGALV